MRIILHDLIRRKMVPVANILYLNFEDERFVEFTYEDFDALYESYLEGKKSGKADKMWKCQDSGFTPFQILISSLLPALCAMLYALCALRFALCALPSALSAI